MDANTTIKMEVQLKRTKITKSILDQSLVGHNRLYLGNPNYDILGWCSVLKGKFRHNYILLYCKLDSTLKKLHYPNTRNITEKEQDEQTRREGTPYDDWYFPTYYYLSLSDMVIVKTRNKEERDSAKEQLQKFLREVEQKGQIYL